MQQIKIKNADGEVTGTININFNNQLDKNNRLFRLSGTRKNLQLPSKWIDKSEKRHWIYSFIYLDEQGGIFEVEIGYNNEFIRLTKC